MHRDPRIAVLYDEEGGAHRFAVVVMQDVDERSADLIEAPPWCPRPGEHYRIETVDGCYDAVVDEREPRQRRVVLAATPCDHSGGPGVQLRHYLPVPGTR